MSVISRLHISGVRNLVSVGLQPSPTLNVLFGENGSGKTSLLESIHLLASGKSFRSNKVDSVINHDTDAAVVFAELAGGYRIGLSKSRRQAQQLHFQDQAQRNWDSVARLLPVQLLDSNSFLLLEGGPRSRRRFLDWGVFHVEPGFVDSWRRSQKCLANRNLLLKQKKVDTHQLMAWSSELAEASADIDAARSRYFSQFVPLLMREYSKLEGALTHKLQLQYLRGWDESRELRAVLDATLQTDIRYGATQNGPHRAEIDIRVGKERAVDVLSRGQQKVLVSAMKLAQGDMLSTSLGRKCIYLADDLPSELDSVNRAAVMSSLLNQGGQLFITCVDKEALTSSVEQTPEMAMFHVERGIITA